VHRLEEKVLGLKMSRYPFGVAIFIIVLLYALVLFAVKACGELPEGMHRANVILLDTLVFRPTINSRWIDSVLRVDSLRLDSIKRRRK
jgi:hypothetical protein